MYLYIYVYICNITELYTIIKYAYVYMFVNREIIKSVTKYKLNKTFC